MPKRPPILKQWRPKHVEKRSYKERGTTAQRGYGSKWQAIRKVYLASNPICVECERPAEQVDHIKPLSCGGTNDTDNLQSLCGYCHRLKTNTVDRYKR